MPLLSNSIYQLWDELAEWPVSDTDNALIHLLCKVSELVDADASYWLSSLRVTDHDKDDPLFGWRPGPIVYYPSTPVDRERYRRGVKDIEAGELSETVINHVKQAGKFRAVLLRDHVSPQFYDSHHYLYHYKAIGVIDSLFVVVPVNSDAEVYFCFNRKQGNELFTEHEIQLASDALRGLKWFLHKTLLHHGLLIADSPLTPTEKRVVKLLLTDLTEKKIAEKLKQKVDTTHKHVSSIYRKFNVKSRAALMAVWLGHQ